jgi:hypothetical protein
MPNDRKSSRLPTSTERVPCELMLGSVVLPAMLLNESQKGFGVLVGGIPSISNNQRAHLHNYRGWFDCQIVYVLEVLPRTTAIYKAAGVYDEVEESDEDYDDTKRITAYDIDNFTADTKGPWFRLGIRWLREIDPVSASAAPLPSASSCFNPIQWIKTVIPSLLGR